jgi:beta-glucosidase
MPKQTIDHSAAHLQPTIAMNLVARASRLCVSIRTGKMPVPLALAALLCAATVRLHAADAEAQAEKLLSQMTLDEKIGQMTQADMLALKDKSDVQKYCLGSVLSGGSSDPAAGNSVQDWLNAVTEFRSYALKTRLKIPLIYGIDAVHGHNNIEGAVIFPHNIGMGAANNRRLVEREEQVTAEEMLGTGCQWAFAPCITVPQNECWGRTYEGYGDAPDLVAPLGAAAVTGFQSRHVLACAKHYIGDGGTAGGKDQGNDVCDEATIRKLYLPSYEAAVKAGAGSIMVSYNSWNGTKMHANRYLMTDVLKGELGFKGFLVSDWAAIDQIRKDYKQDVEISVNGGLDMAMVPNGPGKANNYVEFITDLKELVNKGRVKQSRIDDAVRRILRVKFQMGLFDKPTVDPKLTAAIGSKEHRQVARECVKQSLVLLKNENHALPLSKKIKRLVVVGKGADDMGIQCGGWTISWQGTNGNVTPGGTTILSAIRATAGKGTEVVFSADGADVKGADEAVVVVGEMPYAEGVGDNKNPRVSEEDAALIAKTKAAGVPVVTIILSGRPLILGPTLDTTDALIAAWLPGTEGQGVADVLFGDYKPRGKLPRNWPRDASQLAGYSISMENPQFPRGFGLSY